MRNHDRMKARIAKPAPPMPQNNPISSSRNRASVAHAPRAANLHIMLEPTNMPFDRRILDAWKRKFMQQNVNDEKKREKKEQMADTRKRIPAMSNCRHGSTPVPSNSLLMVNSVFWSATNQGKYRAQASAPSIPRLKRTKGKYLYNSLVSPQLSVPLWSICCIVTESSFLMPRSNG